MNCLICGNTVTEELNIVNEKQELVTCKDQRLCRAKQYQQMATQGYWTLDRKHVKPTKEFILHCLMEITSIKDEEKGVNMPKLEKEYTKRTKEQLIETIDFVIRHFEMKY